MNFSQGQELCVGHRACSSWLAGLAVQCLAAMIPHQQAAGIAKTLGKLEDAAVVLYIMKLMHAWPAVSM